jgi:hypothetical protein
MIGMRVEDWAGKMPTPQEDELFFKWVWDVFNKINFHSVVLMFCQINFSGYDQLCLE